MQSGKAMQIHKILSVAFIIMLFSFKTVSAASVTYGFELIPQDPLNNIEDISSQLSITIWEYDQANTEFGLSLTSSQILFTAQNNVGIASSISEIYFDDGLLGPSQVFNSLGGSTSFTGGGANPGDLPGGGPVGFTATQSFSADAQGNPSLGVDTAQDIVGIFFGLGAFADYNAVVDAVNTGDLRFGYHIRSIGVAGESDSYVSVVPVPAAVWMFGSALGLLGWFRHKSVS